MDPEGKPRPTWLRAIVATIVIVVAAFLVLVVGTNLILTQLGGLARSARVALASVWFFVMLGLLAWAMRRLQARDVV